MKKTISLVLILALGLATEVANADFIWGTPTNLGPEVNTSYGEAGVCISANGLELYFSSNRPGGYGDLDLWVTKRPTIEDDWGDPENLGSPANTQYSYWEPSISSDGLSLYFSDGHSALFGNRLPGGLGGQGDIWMITRETIHDAWGAPVNIGPAVNSQHAIHPSISADGLSLYFQTYRPGSIVGYGRDDLMVATRESTSDSFGNPVFLKNVSSANAEWMPDISTDGRMLFFSRSSATELWMAMRETIYDDFSPPLKLPSKINNSTYLNMSPNLSADGRTLYFASNRPGGVGGNDIWQVSIEPIVDFNGDGIVDAADMYIIVDNWGTDEPLCDIGPMPWGDGIVDVQDLIILAEHLFEEVPPVE
jgi:Tol biopolymer transport system component